MEELRDIRWVARLLGLSERSVYQMVRDGRLPALRVGGRWRFRPAEIEGWLDSVDTRAAPADLIDGGSTRGESGSGEADIAGGRSPEVSLAHVERREFERIVGGIEDTLERRLAFVALLGTASTARGWLPPVVVGGHAVEFYTAGGYATVDIDLVSAHEPLEKLLPEWGFVPRGRHWLHETLGLVVEAPGAYLEAGQRDRVTRVEIAGAIALVLGVEDLIVDRLSACVHWGSEDDCRWAEVLLDLHADRIDRAYLLERARAMEVEERLKAVLDRPDSPAEPA